MRPYSGLSLESCRGEINFSFSNLFAFFGMTTKPSLVEFVSDASFFFFWEILPNGLLALELFLNFLI